MTSATSSDLASQLNIEPEDIDKVRDAFDANYYLECNEDVRSQAIDPFAHFLDYGANEMRRPAEWFDVSFYVSQYGAAIGPGKNPFAHYVLEGKAKGFACSLESFTAAHDEQDVIAAVTSEIDTQFYLSFNPDVSRSGMDAATHYCRFGWREGRDPAPAFSTNFYLNKYPEVRDLDVPPLYHFIIFGRDQGYATSASTIVSRIAAERKGRLGSDLVGGGDGENAGLPDNIDLFTYEVISSEFDERFYREKNAVPPSVTDAVLHFMTTGLSARFNPSPVFNTDYYLRANPDVEAANVNPFFHFIVQGRSEGRVGIPVASTKDLWASSIAQEQANFTARGPYFEDFDWRTTKLYRPAIKALAFYLPQFHAIPENDRWWGEGFTEWRNVARGLPRFKGHYQPRVPRDLGFYDLTDATTLGKQVELAKKAGVFGFAFYYYNFNGKRLLDHPLNALLGSDIEMPFLLVWANENWARTWDGGHNDVLMSQDYHAEDEPALLADWVRHFRDRRYIRIDGRPLLVIYRPGSIPSAKATIAGWRERLLEEYGARPLIFMAQGFDDNDPRVYGLDGAIEFPPHKIAANLPAINSRLEILDPKFGGHVIDYRDVVKRSVSEEMPAFPLIKGATLGWDNDARRPGNGMVLHGASPNLYEEWLRALIELSLKHPIQGESFVVINAWNEWAEAAYLEPDVYFGSAYLNATARAVCQVSTQQFGSKSKLILVGHDAFPHGAQMLLLNICKTLTQQFNLEIVLLLCGKGPLTEDYKRFCVVRQVDVTDVASCAAVAAEMAELGYGYAISNTTVVGDLVRHLSEQGIQVVSLIHELSNFIRERHLSKVAGHIASSAKRVVFASERVASEFAATSKLAAEKAVVRPQGLYCRVEVCSTRQRRRFRDELGIEADWTVVLNVGYGDDRKGFDLFVHTAALAAARDPKVLFLWLGAATRDALQWRIPEIEDGPLARNFRFLGFHEDVSKFYNVADIFFLSSREDPYPSVVLEAMGYGLPVIAFSGATGAEALVRQHGSLANRHDLDTVVDRIEHYARRSASDIRRDTMARQEVIRSAYRFDDYCFDLLKLHHDELVKVSVIVPNYNYAHYIEGRLLSIFGQTYPVFEILFLDDCSSDDSLEVAEQTANQYGRDLRVIRNRKNSGSVFRQWELGVREARGDFIWIAEADDISDPAFLDSLVALIQREEADLVFSDSWQIDSSGNTIGNSYKAYMNRTLGGAFDRSFASSGKELLEQHLSIMNVILNVSAVVWRKTAFLHAIETVGEELFSYSVAGDWRLYIELCLQDGRVAYESRALNGHRRHDTSVTKALDRGRHFDEICKMQSLVRDNVALSDHSRRRSSEFLKDVKQVLAVP